MRPASCVHTRFRGRIWDVGQGFVQFKHIPPYRFCPTHRPTLPTKRFLTTDVPNSYGETHEVAWEGKTLWLRNRPRRRDEDDHFSLGGLLSNRD